MLQWLDRASDDDEDVEIPLAMSRLDNDRGKGMMSLFMWSEDEGSSWSITRALAAAAATCEDGRVVVVSGTACGVPGMTLESFLPNPKPWVVVVVVTASRTTYARKLSGQEETTRGKGKVMRKRNDSKTRRQHGWCRA